jgi:DNA polymerase-3 subunit delta
MRILRLYYSPAMPQPARLRVLIGPDEYAQERAIAALIADMGDPQMAALNTTKLGGSEVTPEALLAATRTVPFLADRRLVIARGLLARFQPAGRQGRSSEFGARSSASSDPSPSEGEVANSELRAPNSDLKTWQPFIESLPDLPEWSTLVLVDPISGEKNRFLAALKPALERMGVRPEVFTLPTGDRLRRRIEETARAAGAGIEPRAAQMLAALYPDNPRLLATEVAKLATYAGDRPIAPDDVHLLVAEHRETNIFELIDRLAEGRAGDALRALARLLEEGTAPLQILNLLARQYRILVQVYDLRRRGEPPGAIQRAVGLSGFAWDKAWSQAQRHTWAELCAGYERLLAADRAIKTGERSDALAVEELVVALAGDRMAAPGSRSR